MSNTTTMLKKRSVAFLANIEAIKSQPGFMVECGNSQPNNGKMHNDHAATGLKKMKEDLSCWTGLYLFANP